VSTSEKRSSAGPADAAFGRFAIRGVLGQGAYGKVYRAFDPELGRDVALKILKRDVSDPEILRRLRHEARALAQLRHRNILRVFEDGLEGSEYYIVSRLVDARPLSAVLAAERAAPRQAASWIRDLAEALAYAHREGILHRDVKPANILITARSEALLADFGLALDMDDVNRAGVIHGTPAYMAPEQARGEPGQVGPHSDQYSLAVVLHELLTGRRPAHDPTSGQPPAPGDLAPDADRWLEAICLKALSVSPADRYATLDAMAEDLDRWLSGKKTKARPRRRPVVPAIRRHATAFGAGAVVLALAALLIVQWRLNTATVDRLDRDRLRIQGERDEKAAELERKAREFDAMLAEQAARFEGERVSFRQPLSRLLWQRAEAFEASGDLLNACVHLAAAIDHAAQGWDQVERQRARDKLALLAGRLIPAAHPSKWPRSGGPMPRVLVPELTEWLGIDHNSPTARWPARQPDEPVTANRPDAARAVSTGGEYAFLFPGSIWRAADGSLTEIARPPSGCSAAAFKPDGLGLLIAYGDRTVRFWDAAAGKPIGKPMRHPQTVIAAAFAPDGRSALAAGQDRGIRRMDPATGRVGDQLLRHPVPVRRLWYQPDGWGFETLGDDGIERHWDTATGTSRGFPVAHDISVTGIASSPDGRSLLKVIQGSLPERRSGQLWDREGRPLGPPFPMYSLPEESRDIDQDGEAILEGVLRGPLAARLAIGHEAVGPMRGGGPAVRLSGDGKSVLTVGPDGSLRLRDMASLRPRGPAFRAPGSILALSRDGEMAATRGPGETVRFWSTTRGKPVAAIEAQGEPVSRLCFSPDGTLALTWRSAAKEFGAEARGEVRRWEVATGRPIDPSLSHGSDLRLAEFSPDGSTILTLGDRDNARLWNGTTGRLIGSWPIDPAGSVLAAAFHPDGKTLATGGTDGTLYRWSTTDGRAAGPPLKADSAIRIIAYAAKGRTLMTISTATTSLWDAATGRRLAPPLPAGGQLLFHPSAPFGAASSRDGMRVLTKEPYGGMTRLWDAATGGPLSPPCAVEGVPALASDDGSTVVTVTAQGPRVWDLIAGTERGTYHPFDDPFEVVARSHDGRKILARRPAGRYQLLDASTAMPAGEPFALDQEIAGLALGPDGRILMVETLTPSGGAASGAWSRIHDAASGKPWGQKLPGGTTAFSPDGQIVVVGSATWHVPVADVDDLRLPSGRPLRLVAFESGGRAVVTVAEPADLCRWDLAAGRVVHRVPDRAGRSALGLSPDGRLAVVIEGKAARLLEIETGRELGPPLDNPKPVSLAAFAPDGRRFVTSDGTTFRTWDSTTGRPVGVPQACQGHVVAIAMGPAGTVYVEEAPAPDADWGHRHIVWKESASRRVGVPETEPGGVATFSPDGRYLYVGGRRSGRLWDLSEDPPRAKSEPAAGQAVGANGIRAAAFGHDGRSYAIARGDATIEVRETATNRRIGPRRKPDGRVAPPPGSEVSQQAVGGRTGPSPAGPNPTTLSFSPDGHTLLIGFEDGLTRLWTIPLNIPENHVARWLQRRTAVELLPDLRLRALDRDELLDRWSEFGEVP